MRSSRARRTHAVSAVVAALGLALPLVATWYLRGIGWAGALGTLAVAATGIAVTRWYGAALTTVRFALLAILLLVLFRGIFP